MNSKVKMADEIFNNGFNCAQAVLSSYSMEYGLDTEIAKKIAGAFGGGIANNGEICGAITGALMLIGLKYGKHKEGDNVSKEKTNKIANEYIKIFKKEYGSIICKDLLKYDLSIEEEAKIARESGLFKTLCPKFVKKSVEIIEEII